MRVIKYEILIRINIASFRSSPEWFLSACR